MAKSATKGIKRYDDRFKTLKITAPANGATVAFTGNPAQYQCQGQVDPAPGDMTLFVVDLSTGAASPNTYTLSQGTITLNGTGWTCNLSGTNDCPDTTGTVPYTIRLTAYDAVTGVSTPCRTPPIFYRNA
jgi:hypothetical protein